MEKEFVSFDLARKLKKKGFKSQCFARYSNGVLLYNTGTFTNFFNGLDGDSKVDAPLISQVLWWLRNEKHLDVSVVGFWYFPSKDVREFKYRFDVSNTLSPGHSIRKIDMYDSYEEAALEGIEFTIGTLM